MSEPEQAQPCGYAGCPMTAVGLAKVTVTLTPEQTANLMPREGPRKHFLQDLVQQVKVSMNEQLASEVRDAAVMQAPVMVFTAVVLLCEAHRNEEAATVNRQELQ